jgi:DNA polymerase III epsilon subunit-like protein
MHYVILDLEWNQPINHYNRTYRQVGDRLIFEMIQIGAVKLDETFSIVDSLSVPIRPTHYTRIHPRIARMTGLNEENLSDQPQFEEALNRFTAWCGEDYALLTWGCDDVSVLQQNMDFFGVHPQLPPLCDIQQLYSKAFNQKNRAGLSAAMEQLGIDPEENKAFHNAVNDAWYTALVFQKLPSPGDLLNYPQQPRQLIHQEQDRLIRNKGEIFETIAEGMRSDLAMKPKCPVCGKAAAVEKDGYVQQSPDKYIGLAKCSGHGILMLRLRLRAVSDRRVWMGLNVSKATRNNVAYIHAKQYQQAQRLAQGMTFDPETALRNAERSNVPFED